MPSAFVDTNIYLYCFDKHSPAKWEIARTLIATLDKDCVTSTQVLQEFYWNAIKKLGLTPNEAKRAVEEIGKRKVVQVVPNMITNAIDTSERYRLTFWDSLILEAAASAKCSVLVSEDLSHGHTIRGVKVQNPFM